MRLSYIYIKIIKYGHSNLFVRLCITKRNEGCRLLLEARKKYYWNFLKLYIWNPLTCSTGPLSFGRHLLCCLTAAYRIPSIFIIYLQFNFHSPEWTRDYFQVAVQTFILLFIFNFPLSEHIYCFLISLDIVYSLRVVFCSAKLLYS